MPTARSISGPLASVSSERLVNLPTQFATIGDSEIVPRGFKVFVSKPCLNGAKRDAVLLLSVAHDVAVSRPTSVFLTTLSNEIESDEGLGVCTQTVPKTIQIAPNNPNRTE